MKRLKKLLKIAALLLGALLVLWLIITGISNWITSSRLEERLAAIRNAGDPVTLADLVRPAPPPEQNAAVVLRRGQEAIHGLVKELYRIEERFPNDPEPVSAAEQQALRHAFEAYPQVLPLLEQAAACPDYSAELPYSVGTGAFMNSLLAEVQQFRTVANLLKAHARLLRAEGKRDEALHCCSVCLQLTRHLEREPILISYLGIIGCRSLAISESNLILRSGPVSDTARTELDQQLARTNEADGYVQALKGERAYGISSFATTFPLTWFNRAFFYNDECSIIDSMNEQIALAGQPYTAAAASETRRQQQQNRTLHPLSTLLFPALVKTRTARDRTLAQIRCLRILNALQQHRVADKQPNLRTLGLPTQAVTDPYDGSAIKVKRVDDDWLIYCVGTNLQDDGGQLKDLLDVGLGPHRPH